MANAARLSFRFARVSRLSARVRAGRGQACDLGAELGGGFVRRVWVPRGAVERERIAGPDQFGLGVEATLCGQHGAAVLPFPTPAAPIPIAVAPDTATAGAVRDADLFDLRGRRRVVDLERRSLCRLSPGGH